MRYFLFFLGLVLIVLGFLSLNRSHSAVVYINKTIRYEVPIMQTRQELEKGLMFVKELPQNKGMLFDFHGYKNIAMWMKNTYISLDMVFIDCALKITDIFENAEPLSEKLIKPRGEVCYALEINGGEVAKQGIKIGHRIEIKQQ